MDSTNTKSGLDHPLAALPHDDLNLITELVLCSGSLKDLAEVYGVSYPTIRLRVDRVIERLKAAVKGKAVDPMNELLARLVERGEMSASGARAVRELSRKMAGGDVVANNNGGGESGTEQKRRGDK